MQGNISFHWFYHDRKGTAWDEEYTHIAVLMYTYDGSQNVIN